MVVPVVADIAGMSDRIAIIGCGNPNRCDDGAGIEVVRLLRDRLGESVHRSKRRLQPEFGKIDAYQKTSAMARERSECVSALGDRIRLLDAGTDGMSVMFAACGCDALIIVDACLAGAEAGAIFEVPGAELAAAPPRDSFTLHDFRWDHALHAGRRMFAADFPAEVSVFLIQAGRVDLGIGLSPAVKDAAGRVAAIIAGRVGKQCAVAEPVS
jgi:hydrogenase maturation protease